MVVEESNEIKILVSLRPNFFAEKDFEVIKELFNVSKNVKKRVVFVFFKNYEKEKKLLKL